MCELFGLSANKKINVNEQLKTFFNHSIEHANGWGLVLPEEPLAEIEKEAVRAVDSSRLKEKLSEDIVVSSCMAHIRKATIGDIEVNNTHPFHKYDTTGRRWILAHNGTIFEAPVLYKYQYLQKGSTDSERILLYLVEEINRNYCEKQRLGKEEEKNNVIEKIIRILTPGNKVNLLIYDGEYFYVHKNQPGTLYRKKIEEGIMFATKPLDQEDWEEVPQNRLMVYRAGTLVYEGSEHENTYHHDEEKMKPIYLAYSGL